jgi:Protein of unknown function DUF262
MATAQHDDSKAVDSPESIEGVEDNLKVRDYPLDDLSIRTETRTIHDVVVRRIGKGFYIMDPDFQRDFVWDEQRQSRLIESVLMRIPLPVFYLAENPDGKLVVVDGLQRLTTFQRFLENKLRLQLDNTELQGKTFDELPPKLQNRLEDTQITLYIIDSKVPDRARLDIFERVNGGVALSRQQMRNAIYQGKATALLRDLAKDPIFLQATGHSLRSGTMRDREAINRFCAFFLSFLSYRSLDPLHWPDPSYSRSASYREDMDQFLGDALTEINEMPDAWIERLKANFLRGMSNSILVFGKHAFRKHRRGQEGRSSFNMCLFDVFSTGLSIHPEADVEDHKSEILDGFFQLMEDDEFQKNITYGTNSNAHVHGRFNATTTLLKEVFGAQ